jgi:hypothetical protein
MPVRPHDWLMPPLDRRGRPPSIDRIPIASGHVRFILTVKPFMDIICDSFEMSCWFEMSCRSEAMLRVSDPKEVKRDFLFGKVWRGTTGACFLLLFTGGRKKVARSLGLRLHRDSRLD